MNKKVLIGLMSEYVVSVVFIVALASKVNALWLFLMALIQIVVSLIINIKNSQEKIDKVVSIFFFLGYTVFQNYIFFIGERLDTLTRNSAFISRGNIEIQLTNPLQNTIVTVLLCVILHWKINGRKNNNEKIA